MPIWALAAAVCAPPRRCRGGARAARTACRHRPSAPSRHLLGRLASGPPRASCRSAPRSRARTARVARLCRPVGARLFVERLRLDLIVLASPPSSAWLFAIRNERAEAADGSLEQAPALVVDLATRVICGQTLLRRQPRGRRGRRRWPARRPLAFDRAADAAPDVGLPAQAAERDWPTLCRPSGRDGAAVGCRPELLCVPRRLARPSDRLPDWSDDRRRPGGRRPRLSEFWFDTSTWASRLSSAGSLETFHHCRVDRVGRERLAGTSRWPP